MPFMKSSKYIWFQPLSAAVTYYAQMLPWSPNIRQKYLLCSYRSTLRSQTEHARCESTFSPLLFTLHNQLRYQNPITRIQLRRFESCTCAINQLSAVHYFLSDANSELAFLQSNSFMNSSFHLPQHNALIFLCSICASFYIFVAVMCTSVCGRQMFPSLCAHTISNRASSKL